MDTDIIKFKIVGILATEAYQKCALYAERLYYNIPEKFAEPVFRPMLDVQWNDYLLKNKRNFSGRLWCLDAPVVVFKNGEIFGDDKDMVKYASFMFNVYLFENFEKMGETQLKNTIAKSERTYVYFTVTINKVLAGTFLIQLYTDLVPLTCANFIRLCELSQGGYLNSPINRIAKTSWIQIGGRKLKRDEIPCENYCIPHDQRGVVSMCHNGKHHGNSTQFFISLNPTPWMDYYYVAFGQVVHGDEVLRKIENVPTKYEAPLVPVVIEDCGEYTFTPKPKKEFVEDVKKYISACKKEVIGENSYHTISLIYPADVTDVRDVDSDLSVNRYKQGYYAIKSDTSII